ncbi:GTP cyclohydrolase I [Microbacterium sp. NPDC058062]|uniref:GTP cyclohydrolase I n=1 Tax=Microbacterium sp. NPDC058062 TaxID=3346320 RepID=UPI0036D97416
MMSTPAHATALHALPDEAPIDRDAAMVAVGDLLAALGFDPDEGDLVETPRRVADAFIEMITPEPFEMTTFPNDDAYDEPVVVRGIPFVSLCRHHLLPFRGTATVGYVPGDRLVGLSKLARVVAHHARGLQVQEALTVQIARTLETALEPRGVGVVVEAEHLCMSTRGVRTETALTTTTAFRGALATDLALQTRFIGARPV